MVGVSGGCEIGGLEDSEGAAEAAKFILVRYHIRPCRNRGKLYLHCPTHIAGGSIGRDHLSSAHVAGVRRSNDEAVVFDGYDLQCREFAIFERVELTLCVVAEELEIRVVHVAGWAGWINTGETAVEAEWEAYVGNAATGLFAWSRINSSSNYVGDEEKKKKKKLEE